jgi:hypothetical protein
MTDIVNQHARFHSAGDGALKSLDELRAQCRRRQEGRVALGWRIKISFS